MASILDILGPFARPFQIRDKPETKRLGANAGYHLTWERKTLPGAGAGQYAWETYGLPPYARFGHGNINVTNPLRETFPAAYHFQAVGIVGNPPSSMVQGQFITQPLMDGTVAIDAGIVTTGAISGGPNAINNPSPILAP
jgi:hypothetical protein